MHYTYFTKGTCSRRMDIDLDGDGRIEQVAIEGGCPGSMQGFTQITKGQMASEVIDRLEGILCAGKRTSCPDQLAKALTEALEAMKEASA